MRTQCANFRLVGLCLALLFSTFAPLSWSQEPKKAGAAGGTSKPGVQKKTYDFKEAGKEMEYALFMPSKYDKEKKSPLIVALHGLGGNPQQIMRSRGLTDQAERHGFIVVAPMGYNNRGWYGALGKGTGFGGKLGGKNEDLPENLGELSEKDVMNVLAEVRKNFSVDEKRIYLMGHSMGGAGTYHLGSKYSETWAGLCPIAAATASIKDVGKLKNIPVFVVHGDKDTVVNVSSARKCVDKLKENKITHEFLEIAGGGHGDVIGTSIPKMFDFFDKHATKKKPEEKKVMEPASDNDEVSATPLTMFAETWARTACWHSTRTALPATSVHAAR